MVDQNEVKDLGIKKRISNLYSKIDDYKKASQRREESGILNKDLMKNEDAIVEISTNHPSGRLSILTVLDDDNFQPKFTMLQFVDCIESDEIDFCDDVIDFNKLGENVEQDNMDDFVYKTLIDTIEHNLLNISKQQLKDMFKKHNNTLNWVESK